MPITPSKAIHDSCAPLSWSTAAVILALEKLRRGRSLASKEAEALSSVAQQLSLLSEASKIRFARPFEDEPEALPAYLQDSFFTLVAIGSTGGSVSDPPELGQAAGDLSTICDLLARGEPVVDQGLLDRVKTVCVDLLEHLNDQRPATSIK